MQIYGFSLIRIFPYTSLDYVHIRNHLAYRKPLYLHILCNVQLILLVNLGDFPPFWKSEILRLVDHFVVCTKIFLEVIGPYKKVKQEFSVDSKVFTELYYRARTSMLWKTFNGQLKLVNKIFWYWSVAIKLSWFNICQMHIQNPAKHLGWEVLRKLANR